MNIQRLKELLNGRGFFASFLVISGWIYVVILVMVLLYSCFKYLLGEKEK